MAPSGPVLVTWANLHYLDFVLNWVAHVRALGIQSYLVGAMDDGILQARAPRSPDEAHITNSAACTSCGSSAAGCKGPESV